MADFDALDTELRVQDIYAIRQFELLDSMDAEEKPVTKLVGLSYPQEYLPGVNEAYCMRDAHRAPEPSCTCGFYAFDDSKKKWSSYATVRAVVRLSGRLALCKGGVRAERMEIVAATCANKKAEERLTSIFGEDLPLYPTAKTMLTSWPVTKLKRPRTLDSLIDYCACFANSFGFRTLQVNSSLRLSAIFALFTAIAVAMLAVGSNSEGFLQLLPGAAVAAFASLAFGWFANWVLMGMGFLTLALTQMGVLVYSSELTHIVFALTAFFFLRMLVIAIHRPRFSPLVGGAAVGPSLVAARGALTAASGAGGIAGARLAGTHTRWRQSYPARLVKSPEDR